MQKDNIVDVVISSTLASSLARVICHPLDTRKARLQYQGLQLRASPVYHHLLYDGGIKQMYAGFGAALLV